MHTELLDKISQGKAYTKVLSSPSESVLQSVRFGRSRKVITPPCHSPFAGTGTEKLFWNPAKHGGETLAWEEGREKHNSIIYELLEELEPDVLIHFGHYIPDVKNHVGIPKNAIDSIYEAIEIAHQLHRIEKSFSFAVVVNDIKIPVEARKRYYSDFKLPFVFYESLQKLEKEIGEEIRLIVISEAKLAEKLRREKKSLFSKGLLTKSADGNYYVANSPSKYPLFSPVGETASPKCVRAFSRLVALPRELGFSSFVQVMPKCGSFNSHYGYSLGQKLFEEVQSVLLYRTHKCW